MGLSAPRNRVKLSKDPNNTNWSRSTDRFGHKILTTYGWAPGTPLGAENAAQATHYTAATFSHIRAVLKDDTRGLGYKKKPAAENETFGLNMFQNVLGRLNGKNDGQLQKDSQNMRDMNLRLYQERKFGAVTFVRGGFLVGDRVEETLPGADGKTPAYTESTIAEKDTPRASESSRKKRKREAESAEQSSSEEQQDGSATERGSEAENGTKNADREARAERKRQRRAKRELKEQKREEKRRKKQQRKEEKEAESTASGTSTPAVVSGTSTPTFEPTSLAVGRAEVRRRFIMQKRMALTSQTALKEIFMLKAN